jgi:hypothetical protein
MPNRASPHQRVPLVDKNGLVTREWFLYLQKQVLAGTTTGRPTSELYAGLSYFDTTLGIPIWYDGSGWIDAAGVSV